MNGAESRGRVVNLLHCQLSPSSMCNTCEHFLPKHELLLNSFQVGFASQAESTMKRVDHWPSSILHVSLAELLHACGPLDHCRTSAVGTQSLLE